MNWEGMRVSEDGTHHVGPAGPLYVQRFIEVLSFHPPGLAAARDRTGAFHISESGEPVYVDRFTRTFGFYESLATVAVDHGWLHIRPDGQRAHAFSFTWAGNFQEGLCAVRVGAEMFHVGRHGGPAYATRYRYVGDFKGGLAVVKDDRGLSTHVTPEGILTHGTWFLDLDVFHKGFARARDSGGWHHVRRDGRQAYSARFASVEPFYNGHAFAETYGGNQIVIDEEGRTVHRVAAPLQQ